MLFKIIEGVREPINLLTCTPPKSGTTSWIRGVAVLKDYLKGIRKKPEDYIPAEIFPARLKDAFSPSQFAIKYPSRFKNFPNVTKVMVQLKFGLSCYHFRLCLGLKQSCPSPVLVQTKSRVCTFLCPDFGLVPDSSLDWVWTKLRFQF